MSIEAALLYEVVAFSDFFSEENEETEDEREVVGVEVIEVFDELLDDDVLVSCFGGFETFGAGEG